MDILGNNTIILYFIAGLTIICYENFKPQQKVVLMYLVTYLVCVLDVLRTIVALVAFTILLFVYLEYLTEDTYKLKIFKRFSYKICDAAFISVFQYYYFLFVVALFLQSDPVVSVYDKEWYGWLCWSISLLALIICIHKTSVGVFELETVTDVMKVINTYPVYSFKYLDEDSSKYELITSIEDKSYFIRANSYNFLSVEFLQYKCKGFYEFLKGKTLKKKLIASWNASKKYVNATKHIRGYSTLEMQLIRNIALKNGYNLVVRRKIFELIYTKIFFSGLKEYYKDNYYTNREHYKEYLLWLYTQIVQTNINGERVRPFNTAFEDEFCEWSMEGLFIATMGLSNKGPLYYYSESYQDIVETFEIDINKATKMYYSYKDGVRLK